MITAHIHNARAVTILDEDCFVVSILDAAGRTLEIEEFSTRAEALSWAKYQLKSRGASETAVVSDEE